LQLLAEVRRCEGSETSRRDAEKFCRWGNAIAAGKDVNTNVVQAVRALIESVARLDYSGDPREDWGQVRKLIRGAGQEEIRRCANNLDYLIAFNRGRIIAGNLAALWREGGTYGRAREALRAALAKEHLNGGVEEVKGIHVMTIHKSKGKQFDAVIIVREGQRVGKAQWQSNMVWRADPPPHWRSRKILRVGITRARIAVLLLEPHYPKCPLLTPHVL
jgi:DNA helicase-2/ATP-dependent DNA helicase PcrA